MSRLRRTGITEQIKVPISIDVPAGTSVFALEVAVPQAWELVKVSDDGQWDERHRKIKWGPFYDDQSRTVVFTAVRKMKKQLRDSTRSGAQTTGPVGFGGAVSFDGINYPIEIR